MFRFRAPVTYCAMGFLAALLVTVSMPAHADVGPEPEHKVSLTFSPIHLVLPMFELQAEFALAPRFGLAGIVGIGSVTSESSDGTSVSALAFEVGAKAAYYAVGDFDHGMQLGIELLYVGLSGESRSSGDKVSVFGNGLSIGAFIGYKIITRVGFTFEAQLGPSLIVAAASSSDGGEASDAVFAPLLNLNVGWSF